MGAWNTLGSLPFLNSWLFRTIWFPPKQAGSKEKHRKGRRIYLFTNPVIFKSLLEEGRKGWEGGEEDDKYESFCVSNNFVLKFQKCNQAKSQHFSIGNTVTMTSKCKNECSFGHNLKRGYTPFVKSKDSFLPPYFDDSRKELGTFPCSGTWNYQQWLVCLLFGEHKVLWDKFHKSVKNQIKYNHSTHSSKTKRLQITLKNH